MEKHGAFLTLLEGEEIWRKLAIVVCRWQGLRPIALGGEEAVDDGGLGRVEGEGSKRSEAEDETRRSARHHIWKPQVSRWKEGRRRRRTRRRLSQIDVSRRGKTIGSENGSGHDRRSDSTFGDSPRPSPAYPRPRRNKFNIYQREQFIDYAALGFTHSIAASTSGLLPFLYFVTACSALAR